MSRELKLRPDYWQSLHPLSFRLRGFYTLLNCLADQAGVVKWNTAQVEHQAGGKGFGMADIVGLGDRVMWLDAEFEDESRLLVVDYLASQNKTLSKSCRGQMPVWRAVARHWPGENGLVEAWREFGILGRLPPIIGEHHGVEHTGEIKPPWRVKLEHNLQESRKVSFPAGLNGEVGEALKEWLHYREQKADESTSQTLANKWGWEPMHAKDVTRSVLQWVEEGFAPASIVHALRTARAGSYVFPFEPRKRK